MPEPSFEDPLSVGKQCERDMRNWLDHERNNPDRDRELERLAYEGLEWYMPPLERQVLIRPHSGDTGNRMTVRRRGW